MIEKTTLIKPNETPILFVNFTDKEFTGMWDSVAYHFKPKETKWLPLWLAQHFAKHLVNDVLNDMKIRTNDPIRESFIAKCIGNKPDGDVKDDPLGLDVLNKNMEAEIKKAKGRTASEEVKEAKEVGEAKELKPKKTKKKEDKEEDSFEGK